MRTVLAVAALIAAPAAAEVKSSNPGHFISENVATVSVSPAATYAMIGRPDQWWNAEHSYSGKAANLSMKLKPGGCFCERIPQGGAIEHLRVIYVQPGEIVRLAGGLGPLQQEPVSGILTFALSGEGESTKITLTYAVSGYIEGGADKLAPLVDQVLREQLDALRRRLGEP